MWCVGFSPSDFSGAVSVPCRHPWVSRGHCSWYKARGLSNGRRAVHTNAALISMMTAHAPNLPRLIRKRRRPMDRIRRCWGQSVRPMNRVRAFNSTADIIHSSWTWSFFDLSPQNGKTTAIPYISQAVVQLRYALYTQRR